MSRLRRPFPSDRFFFVTCNLLKGRRDLGGEDISCLAKAIQSARRSGGFLLTAWVFLPDHWHAILFPRYPLTISQVMKVIKVRSTHSINLSRGESGQLWQARFFDHVLRTVEAYQDCLTYIHSNPVKRGLVREPEGWKWSSMRWYLANGHGELAIDKVRLPADLSARLY